MTRILRTFQRFSFKAPIIVVYCSVLVYIKFTYRVCCLVVFISEIFKYVQRHVVGQRNVATLPRCQYRISSKLGSFIRRKFGILDLQNTLERN